MWNWILNGFWWVVLVLYSIHINKKYKSLLEERRKVTKDALAQAERSHELVNELLEREKGILAASSTVRAQLAGVTMTANILAKALKEAVPGIDLAAVIQAGFKERHGLDVEVERELQDDEPTKVAALS